MFTLKQFEQCHTLKPWMNPWTENEWNKKISVKKVIQLLPNLNGHFSEKSIFSIIWFRQDIDDSDLNNSMVSWDNTLWGRDRYTAPGVVATPKTKTNGTLDEYELWIKIRQHCVHANNWSTYVHTSLQKHIYPFVLKSFKWEIVK